MIRNRKGIRIKFGLTVISIIISFAFLWNSCTQDPATEREYLKFRAEGIPVSESAWSGAKYIRKYYRKRFLAPDSTVDYFKRQAVLNKSLQQFDDQPKRLSLAFLGDIMWIRNNWNGFLSTGVKSYLEEMDMVFGNLETPVDTCMPVPSFFPDYFSYNSSPDLINSFTREEGRGNILTAVSVSNNHAFDRGPEGLVRTTEFLNSRGIGFSGVSREGGVPEEYLKFTGNGIKIGFYAASWGLNNPEDQNGELKINIIPGIAPLDPERIDLSGLTEVLRKMSRDSIDIKILSLHWGYEYELYPDPAIMNMARMLASKGADIIIGSHPHVIQPNEICLINGYHELIEPALEDTTGYCILSDSAGIPRKSLIIYSPGNFSTAMYTSLCRLGAVNSVNLFVNPVTGRIDWTVPAIRYVYNTPSDPVTHLRKLMFLEEFIKELERKSPSKAAKIKNETAVVF